jgi:hypothetical protein
MNTDGPVMNGPAPALLVPSDAVAVLLAATQGVYRAATRPITADMIAEALSIPSPFARAAVETLVLSGWLARSG